MTIRPERHGQPEGAARIMSIGLAAALDPFSDPELLGQGKVNLVTLDALAASGGRSVGTKSMTMSTEPFSAG